MIYKVLPYFDDYILHIRGLKIKDLKELKTRINLGTRPNLQYILQFLLKKNYEIKDGGVIKEPEYFLTIIQNKKTVSSKFQCKL